MSPTNSVSEIGAGNSPAPFAAPNQQSHSRRMLRWARRFLFWLHRWLGIVIALLMAVWALSGLVMMYVSFPETTREERLAGLGPLGAWECCGALSLPQDPAIHSASIEMLGGEPVLRWQGERSGGVVSLASGRAPALDKDAAGAIAAAHFERNTGGALKPIVERIELDQWTVYGQYREHQPLYKASFADAAGTVLYVSGRDGTIVQDTDAHQRFWNWLGAVPHWLYFTALRQNGALWSGVVVYGALLGVFLTVTGLWIGILRFGRGKRKSPYRGLMMWHHWTGLIFGLFTLTWTLSGLFSMQPWGMFESEGPGREMAAMIGRPATSDDLVRFVSAVAAHPETGAVSISLSMQEGQPWAIMARADGSAVRAEFPSLTESPLAEAELAARAALMRPEDKIASQGLIREPDAYYYGHKREVPLPVYRIVYDDAEQTRFYFDPRTGELVNYVDAAGRGYRWWFNALHRMDFAEALRARPVWDIVTLPLMLGVSLLTVIGLVLGVRHLRRMARR
jgi:uncharacterized iron-regulated membrane protein